MNLTEMDERLRKLWRATHDGDQDDQERYVMELQRQLKHAYVLVVNTNTWYGRATPPLLSQQFNRVQEAWGLVTEYGRLPFRLGVDEDAFFTANAHPDLPLMVINAYNNNQRTIELGGYEFHIDPDNMDDSEFYLTSYDEGGGHDIRLVIKDELENPKPTDYAVKRLSRIMTGTEPITKDPITTWWENYGQFSGCPIDQPAQATIEQLNLDLSEHTGGAIEAVEEFENLEESLMSRLDNVLYESPATEMAKYVNRYLMKFLNIVYPGVYSFVHGSDHNAVISTENGKKVTMANSPSVFTAADVSIPRDFRNTFNIRVPSYPGERRIFTNARLAHEYAGVPYIGPERKRRVNPKLVKAQELQELQEIPQAIEACAQNIEHLEQELISLYSTASKANVETAIPLATELEQEKKRHEQLENRHVELMIKHDG